MATTLTAVNIANQALANLGEDPITAFTDPTKRARIVNEHYPTIRDATLQAHPWTFALQRTTLLAYTEPAGTLTPGAGALTVDTEGVIFTASQVAFVAGDVGKELRGDGVAGGATITGFTDTQHVTATIDTAFAALTAIVTGAWRLYNAPPAWGFSFTILKPAGCLAVYRQEDSSLTGAQGGDHLMVADPEPYQIETDGTQEVLINEADSINVRLLLQVTDPTRFSPIFVRAFVSHLSAVIAEPITGQAGKSDRFWNLYQALLKRARSDNLKEGSRNIRRSSPLVDVRTNE